MHGPPLASGLLYHRHHRQSPSRLNIEIVSFLASQDALEVMRVTELLTELLTGR